MLGALVGVGIRGDDEVGRQVGGEAVSSGMSLAGVRA